MNRLPNCTIEFWDELTPEEYPYPFAIVVGQEIQGFTTVEDRFQALSSPFFHAMIIRNSTEQQERVCSSS